MLTIEDLRRPNFAPEEFIKSETAERLGIKNIPNQLQLICGMKNADKMQELRNAIGRPFHMTSSFRCPELNAAIGGAPGSWHTQFLADDFNIEGMEPHEGVLAIKRAGVSVDKCFVERGCIHVQFCMDDARNRNFFGSAFKINGEWVVTDKIQKV